ncbi:hypothetical protein DFS34DRAFT_645225 [Phlyctochytrium arcticum]|nr:hypothetical protein DFS34DRAFT_645225 [Phlyctochytrium arcticum]
MTLMSLGDIQNSLPLLVVTLPFLPFLIVSFSISLWVVAACTPILLLHGVLTVLVGILKAIWRRKIQPTARRMWRWIRGKPSDEVRERGWAMDRPGLSSTSQNSPWTEESEVQLGPVIPTEGTRDLEISSALMSGISARPPKSHSEPLPPGHTLHPHHLPKALLPLPPRVSRNDLKGGGATKWLLRTDCSIHRRSPSDGLSPALHPFQAGVDMARTESVESDRSRGVGVWAARVGGRDLDATSRLATYSPFSQDTPSTASPPSTPSSAARTPRGSLSPAVPKRGGRRRRISDPGDRSSRPSSPMSSPKARGGR